MYYSFGKITIYFSRFQDNFYVATWDDGNVVVANWEQFISEIVRRTGVNRDELIKNAKEYFGLSQAQKSGGTGSLTIE
ncbi:hypothetical protein ACN5LI_001105 [Cronobacter turicensis]